MPLQPSPRDVDLEFLHKSEYNNCSRSDAGFKWHREDGEESPTLAPEGQLGIDVGAGLTGS